ncbi:hypothetical protein ABE15_27045 [Bacillus cereus]|nr:hypothetical protein [Bacillus cereus]
MEYVTPYLIDLLDFIMIFISKLSVVQNTFGIVGSISISTANKRRFPEFFIAFYTISLFAA